MKLLPFVLLVLFLIIVILFVIKFLIYPNKDLYNTIKSIKYEGDFKIPRILHQIWLQGYNNIHPSVKK